MIDKPKIPTEEEAQAAADANAEKAARLRKITLFFKPERLATENKSFEVTEKMIKAAEACNWDRQKYEERHLKDTQPVKTAKKPKKADEAEE